MNLVWGAWVAQLVKHPTSAQVMISQLVGSSPALGSVLTARSLEPALILCLPLSLSLSLSLSLPLPCSRSVCVSLSLSKINIKKIKKKKSG